MLKDVTELNHFARAAKRIRDLLVDVPLETKLRRNCCPHCALHQRDRPCVWPESMCPYLRAKAEAEK